MSDVVRITDPSPTGTTKIEKNAEFPLTIETQFPSSFLQGVGQVQAKHEGHAWFNLTSGTIIKALDFPNPFPVSGQDTGYNFNCKTTDTTGKFLLRVQVLDQGGGVAFESNTPEIQVLRMPTGEGELGEGVDRDGRT